MYFLHAWNRRRVHGEWTLLIPTCTAPPAAAWWMDASHFTMHGTRSAYSRYSARSVHSNRPAYSIFEPCSIIFSPASSTERRAVAERCARSATALLDLKRRFHIPSDFTLLPSVFASLLFLERPPSNRSAHADQTVLHQAPSITMGSDSPDQNCGNPIFRYTFASVFCATLRARSDPVTAIFSSSFLFSINARKRSRIGLIV